MAKSFKPKPYRGKPIWVADAETDPFRRGRVPTPFIWGLYNGDDYWQFTDTESFVEFVQEQDIIVYAHNGGKFDWHFITQYIQDFEPLTIIAGRLAKFQIGFAEFRDSYNIVPAPLSAYQKDEIDYNIFEIGERNKPENWAKITSYLRSDCVYLHEMVMQFINDYGMSLTQAGAAMKVWSKISGIKKPQTSAGYYADLSPYYYGGRVECFKTGIIEMPFNVIDIKSAYPWAMTFAHPWGVEFSTYDTIEAHWTDEELSRCFITLDARSMGAFPSRTETGLSFPNDNELREFDITGWEYLAARDTGCLKNVTVKIVRKYFETVEFNDYVDYFFALKTKAEEMMKTLGPQHNEYAYWVSQRLFAKLFLNSLYGKFASNPENYEEFMTLPASMIEGAASDGWTYCKLLCEETAVVNKPLAEEKHRFYDVAVAASITGCVRAYLWRNIYACGETILYCDTDSIAAGFTDKIEIGNRLGQWEQEAQCDFAAIAGKKLYAFRKVPGSYNPQKEGPFKTASKGVRLDPQEIIAVAAGHTVTYEPEAPTFSVKGGIRFTPRRIKMLENA